MVSKKEEAARAHPIVGEAVVVLHGISDCLQVYQYLSQNSSYDEKN